MGDSVLAAWGPQPLPTPPPFIMSKAQLGVPAGDQAQDCGKFPGIWLQPYVLAQATTLCPAKGKH